MRTSNLGSALLELPKRITRVHAKSVEYERPFVELARRFAHLPGTVALVSGGTLDCARYNVLGVMPWLVLEAREDELRISTSKASLAVKADPFDALQVLVHQYGLSARDAWCPLSAGLLGYLAYDLKDRLEELPRSSEDDLQLPDLYLAAPSVLLIEDRLDRSFRLLVPQLDDDEAAVGQRFDAFERILAERRQPPRGEKPTDVQGKRTELEHDATFVSGFTRQEYLEAVKAVQDYIVRGHVYQVNLSQRYQAPFRGDPYTLFENLFARNPAPFFAYVNAGDHQIVSTSPERFLLLRQDSIETRPIKGTRPRGKTAEEDERLRQSLESSPKDDAEISMIVDLLRNDIGKVCRVDSVEVSEHKRVEAYENVYHLVSIVRGTLDEGKDVVDLIRATFPGGSITGCPKIRAMEIIDELEPVRRHVYTGSIGYIGFDGNMDLSIAIRTATIAGGKLVFSVGGGIVYDSNPADEFDETLHKGRTLIDSLGTIRPERPPAQVEVKEDRVSNASNEVDS